MTPRFRAYLETLALYVFAAVFVSGCLIPMDMGWPKLLLLIGLGLPIGIFGNEFRQYRIKVLTDRAWINPDGWYVVGRPLDDPSQIRYVEGPMPYVVAVYTANERTKHPPHDMWHFTERTNPRGE